MQLFNFLKNKKRKRKKLLQREIVNDKGSQEVLCKAEAKENARFKQNIKAMPSDHPEYL